VLAWFALPKKDIQNQHALVVAGFAGVLALIINVIISHIWFRPRPFTVFQKGTQLIPHSSDASFPSDHTSGSFGFAPGLGEDSKSGLATPLPLSPSSS
jgi:undecaprenyl-diphosphatase